MRAIFKTEGLVEGHLYGNMKLDKEYELKPHKMHHYFNHWVTDEKGKKILVSNTALKKHFKIV